MAGNIKFSPEEGRQMANEIDRSKCEIEDTINRLTNLINGELCANWEGAA
ncbi:WXG100 family type VII secretion target, partial [Clostridium perfringens]|nr:WXG100 family type VII secretion target [Clostridium perfringens]